MILIFSAIFYLIQLITVSLDTISTQSLSG